MVCVYSRPNSNSYIQVNIYGVKLRDLEEKGLNISSLLKDNGVKNCVLIEVPITSEEKDFVDQDYHDYSQLSIKQSPQSQRESSYHQTSSVLDDTIYGFEECEENLEPEKSVTEEPEKDDEMEQGSSSQDVNVSTNITTHTNVVAETELPEQVLVPEENTGIDDQQSVNIHENQQFEDDSANVSFQSVNNEETLQVGENLSNLTLKSVNNAGNQQLEEIPTNMSFKSVNKEQSLPVGEVLANSTLKSVTNHENQHFEDEILSNVSQNLYESLHDVHMDSIRDEQNASKSETSFISLLFQSMANVSTMGRDEGHVGDVPVSGQPTGSTESKPIFTDCLNNSFDALNSRITSDFMAELLATPDVQPASRNDMLNNNFYDDSFGGNDDVMHDFDENDPEIESEKTDVVTDLVDKNVSRRKPMTRAASLVPSKPPGLKKRKCQSLNVTIGCSTVVDKTVVNNNNNNLNKTMDTGESSFTMEELLLAAAQQHTPGNNDFDGNTTYGSFVDADDQMDEEQPKPKISSGTARKRRRPSNPPNNGDRVCLQCQYENCGMSILKPLKAGITPLLDHTRTHWGRKLKGCKQCSFVATAVRQIRYHHKKKHGGLPWNGHLDLETKEDNEDLLRLWNVCFPGQISKLLFSHRKNNKSSWWNEVVEEVIPKPNFYIV